MTLNNHPHRMQLKISGYKERQEGDNELHKNTFSSTGWDLQYPVPVVELPDGTLIMMNAHHRVAAMEKLS